MKRAAAVWTGASWWMLPANRQGASLQGRICLNRTDTILVVDLEPARNLRLEINVKK